MKGLAGALGVALRRTAKYGGGFVAANRPLRHAPFRVRSLFFLLRFPFFLAIVCLCRRPGW